MLSIADRDSITSALTNHELDPGLRALIGLRAWQLDVERERPLSDTIRFVVVQPGDPPDVINEAVGFPITWEQAEQPSFEWMEDHGSPRRRCLYDDGPKWRTMSGPQSGLRAHYPGCRSVSQSGHPRR